MLTFREVDKKDADLILNWRIREPITKFMSTDIIYDLDAQAKWISSCNSKEHYYHWIILNDDIPIGLINLADYSSAENTTSWGFYIGAEGFDACGAFIPPYFYNFLFFRLSVNRIHVEVFYNNTNVIGLHLLHGYKFSPVNDRVITKNGKDILLISMILEKSNWNFRRYEKNIANFPMSKWQARPIFINHQS